MLPNPPPTSGEITRSLLSGIPSVNAESSSRIGWGFWLVVQTVISSEAASHCAAAARGSIAVGMRRWFTSSTSTTSSASANAFSQASWSPRAQWYETLSSISAWTRGAPSSMAPRASTTVGSGS